MIMDHIDHKATVKVLQPPGGGSSDIFASDNDSTPSPNSEQSRSRNMPTKSTIFDPPETTTPQRASNQKSDQTQNRLFGDHPAQELKQGKGKGQQGTHNPITGEPYAASQSTGSVPDKPSTRVKQPPGGASSGLW